MKKPFFFFFFFLIVLFLGQFLFVSPVGEFSLNDDWVHTSTIMEWVDTGEFRLLPWAGPTFYTPIVYGAGLTSSFGFSFTILRLSTLFLTLILLLGTYLFLHTLTKRPQLSFLATLTLWLSPLLYSLSFTFMTDVPALFFLLFGIISYWYAFKTQRPFLFFIGALFSIVGFYTRQTVILLFMSAGLVWFFTHIRNRTFFSKQSIQQGIFGFVVPGVLLILSYLYLYIFALLPANAGAAHIIHPMSALFSHILHWGWFYLLLIGGSLIPLTFGWIGAQYKYLFRPLFWYITIPVTFLSFIWNHVWPEWSTHVGNIFTIYGLGPSEVIQGLPTPFISSSMQIILVLFCAFSLSLLIFFFLTHRKHVTHPQSLFLILFSFVSFGVFVSVYGFDRYVLPLILTMLILYIYLLSLSFERISFFITMPLIILIAFFSLSQTDHYLSWNQARTQLATYPPESTAIESIDGGYEWNGVHAYWSAYESTLTAGTNTSPWWIRNMFFNNTEEYIVSWTPIPGYRILQKESLSTWHPHDTLFLLHRE
ncbi:MAG: hypothetical protein HN429_01710 [Candidatus Magasanikbacteria bacterium]|jgi:hypothetical protein|nr:hypothetical protein [Candidatus Magasanikbacteria bacterium]MBT4220880.1 hypothetical protein [Candidatus Magasanikbacteria bacterium]MBT4350341.1 hypothetical protein [Candidatus Magasanikbacteria bacterium]MBT6252799.1 hypothetical protein [Candidatus Magasanikbacteria bacterium]